jgi:hypothetical protein
VLRAQPRGLGEHVVLVDRGADGHPRYVGEQREDRPVVTGAHLGGEGLDDRVGRIEAPSDGTNRGATHTEAQNRLLLLGLRRCAATLNVRAMGSLYRRLVRPQPATADLIVF